MIQIKDLNHKISEHLTDSDVISLTSVNSYYYNIFDDAYWRRRFLSFFSDILPDEYNIYNEPWKKYYLLVRKWTQGIHYEAIKFAIEEDRVDLLKMVSHNRDLKIIRDWDERNHKSFVPIHLSIKKDSLKCFKYISSTLYIHSPHMSLNEAITYHAHKIVEYLKEYTTERQIICVFDENCITCAKLLEESFYDNIEKVIESLYFYKSIVEKISENNEAFSLFVNKIPYDILIKHKKAASFRDRYDIAKCLTKYTSYFK